MYTYYGLKEYIEKGKNKLSRRVMNNTIARKEFDTTESGSTYKIVIQYHNTDVAILYQDGTREFHTGGWMTSTTKLRLNEFLPSGWTIYQSKGIWYLWDHQNSRYENRTEYVFQDGITIHPDGSVTGYAPKTDEKDTLILRKKLRKFAKAYMQALLDGKVESPSSGDCFACQFGWNETDHIDSHIKESYFVPSLFMNAINEFPVSRMAMWGLHSLWNDDKFEYAVDILKEQGTKSLTKYLYKQYGLSR